MSACEKPADFRCKDKSAIDSIKFIFTLSFLNTGDALMSLKQELLKNVPLSIQEEPYFLALLDHMKTHEINSKEHLDKFLSQEISLLEAWMEENKRRGTVSVKSIRERAVQIDMLKKCSKLSDSFLN